MAQLYWTLLAALFLCRPVLTFRETIPVHSMQMSAYNLLEPTAVQGTLLHAREKDQWKGSHRIHVMKIGHPKGDAI